jgi:hypothetical protein
MYVCLLHVVSGDYLYKRHDIKLSTLPPLVQLAQHVIIMASTADSLNKCNSIVQNTLLLRPHKTTASIYHSTVDSYN